MADTACYLYAVTRGVDPSDLASLRGIGDAPVRLVPHAELQGVVSDVPLEEFDEQGLKENLEELTWVEEVARRHHHVVDGVAATGATAPLRLATIFFDDSAVAGRLEREHHLFGSVLDRIEGRREWSVKLLASDLRTKEPGPVETGSGAEFLRQKKQLAHERETRRDEGTRAAEAVHTALSKVAEASRLLPPQDPQLTGYSGVMVLNGTYLVPAADHDRFVRRVDELTAEHPDLRFEGGGPWPPYSFATVEDA